MVSWEAACKAADITNCDIKEALPPPMSGDCSDKVSQTTFHPCQKYLQLAFCEDILMSDEGIRKRPRCLSQENALGVDVLKSQAKTKAAELLFRKLRSLWFRLLDRDFSAKGIAEKSKQYADIEKAVDERLRDQLRGTEFFNAYTGKWQNAWRQNASGEDIGETRGPFAPSIEAVFPFDEWKSSRWVHNPDNVVLTNFSLNTMKHYFVPAVLAVVAEFSRSPKKPSDVVEVLRRADQISKLAL